MGNDKDERERFNAPTEPTGNWREHAPLHKSDYAFIWTFLFIFAGPLALVLGGISLLINR